MAEDKQALEQKILDVLKKDNALLTPQEIAHRVGFARPNNQASKVNPTLYTLLERGEIVRATNLQGHKPHYAIMVKDETPSSG